MPIINPWLFYLIDLFGGIKSINMFVLIELIVVLSISILIHIVEIDEGFFTKKYFKYMAISVVISCIVMLVIPSKETMYKMVVAQNVTYENVEIASETIKDSVDYIIEKMRGE